MTDKVVSLVKAKPDLSADEVLENAKGQLETVLIIGYNHDGGLDVCASPDLDNANILWLVECFKQYLIDGSYE